MFDDTETKVLYDTVFNLYYDSEFRAWDIDRATGFDKDLYSRVLNSV